MARTLMHGNRMRLPKIKHAQHFFYKTTGVAAELADTAVLVEAVKQAFAEGYRQREVASKGSFVESFSSKDPAFADNAGAAAQAFDKLTALLAAPMTKGTVQLVACPWVAPHEDDSFCGSAFYSLVLHTGPSDYMMQTLHTDKQPKLGFSGERTPGIRSTSRFLSDGDYFVFDPTTPHWAYPKHPHPDSLLILAQVELRDQTQADREEILRVLPQRCDDKGIAGYDERRV